MTFTQTGLTHIDAFAGIGANTVAAQWAGFKTIQFIELNKYRQRVLTKNYPNIPIHDDINTFTVESIHRGATVVSAGFPCQDLSQAGKREGLEGERSGLVWRLLKVIAQIGPDWVILENSPNITNLGVDRVHLALESQGYATRAFVFPANACGIQFEGYRWVLVSKAMQSRLQRGAKAGERSSLGSPGEQPTGVLGSEIAQQAMCVGRPGQSRRRTRPEFADRLASLPKGHWSEWNHKPLLVRGVDGIPAGVDRRIWTERIRALGDCVPPQQLYPIYQSIADEYK